MSTPNNEEKKQGSAVREMCIFAMLAAVMFVSKLIMELLPNIHLLGVLTMAYTVAFRKKALIPIYVYVFLNGVYSGFATWWIAYLYIWAILFGITMLVPEKTPKKIAAFIYPAICCLHGLLFGVLYAPAQALIFGFNFEQTLAWIASGFVFDIIHGVSNLFAGLLVIPLSELLKKLMKSSG